MELEELHKEFTEFKFGMNLFKGHVESEIGNSHTRGNIGRHMKDLNELLEKHIEETKQLSDLMVQMRIDMAVHEVKLARSGAFYGAVSGMIIAIVTALIINFATSSQKTESPKVIYKEETR